MSHVLSPLLIIICEKQAHRIALQEACLKRFETVRVCKSFSEAQLDDVEKDSFILTTISAHNHAEAVKCASNHTVFVFVEDESEFNVSIFEGVFQYPVRLGKMVEAIKGVVEQKALHKRMASITLGDVVLDPKTSSLSHGNKISRLTEKEAAILIFLSKQNGVAISRQHLLDEVWGYAKDVETHTLETHIYRLRQKIKTQLSLDDFLVTSDDGYILNF